MPDVLTKLIEDAIRRVNAGYYEVKDSVKHAPISLRSAIRSAKKNAIIAEIKPISPALGPLRPDIDPVEAAVKLARGGAVALSVLTEPDNFGGDIRFMQRVRKKSTLPLLMKDIIVHTSQIQAGRKTGADCVLLIESVFSRHPIDSLDHLVNVAHSSQLEVLLEVHTEEELSKAMGSAADIIGINNRNLTTLETDLDTTVRLLKKIDRRDDKVIISESGFSSPNDIRKVKPTIVNGFLIGSSIMLSHDFESKVREFVLA